MEHVTIIGGGIIGQFCAYYLSQHFDRITIIDDDMETPPASSGNCGLITPSHIIPFNQWSAVIQGIRWLGRKDAPLSIRPQWSFDFFKWFYSFLVHCKPASQQKASKTLHSLLSKSYQLYLELFDKERLEVDWHKEGILYVCKTPKGLKELQNEKAFLDQHHLPNELLTKEELLHLEPSLSDDIVGGAIFYCDGWLHPGLLLHAMKKLNKSRGVRFIKSTATSLSVASSSISGIHSSENYFTADLYVLCAGVKSVNLLKQIGINIPIIPGKGYNLTFETNLPSQPKRPVYMVERKVVATPWSNGFRLGSTMEFSGYDLSLNKTRLDALLSSSREYLKTEISLQDHQPWAGLRPMSSTGMPVIERSMYHNLLLAVGHGMLGLSTAPATGELISKIALNEK